MSSSMTTEQVRQMVHQLATNDEFRSLFEESPAKALVQLGVSEDVIAGLDAKCLKPCKLGSKEVFQMANASLDEAAAQRFATFVVPGASFPAIK